MVLIVDSVVQDDDGNDGGDDGDEGSGGWFCKFSQGRMSLFIISEGRDGKLGGLRSKQASRYHKNVLRTFRKHLSRIGKIRGSARCNQRVV